MNLSLLCISICSQPFQIEFALPSKKSIGVSSPRSGLYKGCTELLGRGGRISLPPCSPLGGLNAVEWRRGRHRSVLQCGRAGLQVTLTLGKGLGWLELAPEKYSMSGSPALVLERSPKHVR